ncbi:MAG TPA: hypothetical protein VFN53_06345 [Acidobacteriaceae bacterium]|nr:hypothetical protein [Acidobacteriaceae bacterium]
MKDTKHYLQGKVEEIIQKLHKEAPQSLRSDLEELQRVTQAWQLFADIDSGKVRRSPGQLTPISSAREAIEFTLTKAGKPMTRDEIAAVMIDEGWGLNRPFPRKSINAAISLHIVGKDHGPKDWPELFVELPDGRIAMAAWPVQEKTGDLARA